MKSISAYINRNFSITLIICSSLSILPLLFGASTSIIGMLSFYTLLLALVLHQFSLKLQVVLFLLGTFIAATHGWVASIDLIQSSIQYQSSLLVYALLAVIFALQLAVLFCSNWIANTISSVVFDRSVFALLVVSLVHIPASEGIALMYYVPFFIVGLFRYIMK